MPKRQDIKSILIIGAGPIVIGQACEFDYSGTQAVKALKEEGYRVILVNSNPATIMTDPGLADATYVEPITPEVVAKIIAKERPDALLPTMGGQTALNTALSLKRMGVLDRYNVEMIGAKPAAIDKAEDRALFREAMAKIGLETPKSMLANATDIKDADRKTHEAARNDLKARLSGADLDKALDALENQWNLGESDRKQRYMSHAMAIAAQALDVVGLPAIIRPSFTMGGTGGGIAYNRSEFFEIIGSGLDASPTTEVLIEESVLGWKEYEMEVVRDKADNCIIICSIENIDPMGVHTGDSITVAPALTLTDKEYQMMRNASIAVLREIGVETGGSNVQFAVNPKDGRLVVIEMNPRVSRSSALASKATGFPIARVAAKLAVGYTLDELENDITGGATPASFEPSIDYVVTKIPRFAFEKFPGAEPTLTTAMKSVGEVMAIGRTFAESLQKALRGLETGLTGLDEIEIPGLGQSDDKNAIRAAIGTPTPDRLRMVAQALRLGMSPEEVHEGCKIDPWFIAQLKAITDMEARIREHGLPGDAENLRMLKAMGFSDARLASLTGKRPKEVAEIRNALNVRPVFKRIDTCAAEFASPTAYMYSTYETPFVGELRSEAQVSDRKKVVILGGGPNRIGQGIEFDYCCCHAAFATLAFGKVRPTRDGTRTALARSCMSAGTTPILIVPPMERPMKAMSADRHIIRFAMAQPYLERQEELDLAIRWKDDNDQDARNRIAHAHMRLVIAMASKFRGFGLPLNDLIQEGYIGLLEAAARFEPAREVRFSTYAGWWIRASMQDYILRNWSIVRGGTSSSQKALFFNLRRLRAKLAQGDNRLSDQAIHQEIASALGVSLADVQSMDARLSGNDASLQAPIKGRDGDGSEQLEMLESDDLPPDEQVSGIIDGERWRGWLNNAMTELNDRENRIIKARRLSEDGATLEELGAELGISKERVRQIETRALEKLKTALTHYGPKAEQVREMAF
ncbi:MAG: carbamoyl-phosphate synthase large subunit [Rhizobium sp.]|nr:carbamoyl-phosphate synthase large subunit [Rhizobium sp.]